MPPVIFVFAKAPVAGQVKTRLQPFLSPAQCAELHLSFVGDVLEWLEGFRHLADIELHTDYETAAWSEFTGVRKLQRGGDLGGRMLGSAREALAQGRPQVVILGSDSPDLPAGHLLDLLNSRADVALGPAEDGGYYAIAFRNTADGIFDGVEWSTDRTLAQTAAGVRRCGLTLDLGKAWSDVDEPADLRRLMLRPVPPRTAAWLKNHQLAVDSGS